MTEVVRDRRLRLTYPDGDMQAYAIVYGEDDSSDMIFTKNTKLYPDKSWQELPILHYLYSEDSQGQGKFTPLRVGTTVVHLSDNYGLLVRAKFVGDVSIKNHFQQTIPHLLYGLTPGTEDMDSVWIDPETRIVGQFYITYWALYPIAQTQDVKIIADIGNRVSSHRSNGK